MLEWGCHYPGIAGPDGELSEVNMNLRFPRPVSSNPDDSNAFGGQLGFKSAHLVTYWFLCCVLSSLVHRDLSFCFQVIKIIKVLLISSMEDAGFVSNRRQRCGFLKRLLTSRWEALRISKRLVEVIGTRLCSFLA